MAGRWGGPPGERATNGLRPRLPGREGGQEPLGRGFDGLEDGGVAGSPAELLARQEALCVKGWRIARTPRRADERHRTSRRRLDRLEDLEDGVPDPGREVERRTPPAVSQPFGGQ